MTTVAQTLFDLAGDVDPWRLERALDDAMFSDLVTLDPLEARLSFYSGSRRRGLPRTGALVADRRATGWVPPESELEARLYVVLGQLPSQPRVVRQASLPWRPSAAGRVDALLPDHRVVVEADGRRWHARLADFDRDRRRDNEAAANRYRVLRFTWAHLCQFTADTIDVIERTVDGPAASAA